MFTFLHLAGNGSVYEALGVLKHQTFNLLCRLFIFIIFQFNYHSPNDLYTVLALGFKQDLLCPKTVLRISFYLQNLVIIHFLD